MVESCSFCNKKVICHDKAICCDFCNKWIDIKCKELNDLDYEYLKLNENSWYCKICTTEILPFCKTLKDFSKSDNDNKLSNNINVNLKNLLLQLNNLTNNENNKNNDLPNSKCKNQEYFSTLTIK